MAVPRPRVSRRPGRCCARSPGGAGAPPSRLWPKGGLMGGRRLLKTPMPRSAMISILALGVLAIATVAMTTREASLRYFRIQSGWSKGGAAVKLIGNQLEMLVEDMPSPAAGMGYQVWVVQRSDQEADPDDRLDPSQPPAPVGRQRPGQLPQLGRGRDLQRAADRQRHGSARGRRRRRSPQRQQLTRRRRDSCRGFNG